MDVPKFLLRECPNSANRLPTGTASSSSLHRLLIIGTSGEGPPHLTQMNFAETTSVSGTPAHLVCCQTPQLSQANILSPSSSLAPHVQSTTQFSVPRSIRNR